MGYHLAPSLSRLRDEVNKRWPDRSKASDGWIGDPAHASRVSQHNPNERGSVNALDITNDGIDVDYLIGRLVRHPSVWYVISRGYIYSRTHGFAKRPYSGSNKHNSHVHVSILSTRAAEESTVGWLGSPFPLSWPKRFGWKLGAKVSWKPLLVDQGSAVRAINEAFDMRTPYYTENTMRAVMRWERAVGLPVTGMIDKRRWARLGL